MYSHSLFTGLVNVPVGGEESSQESGLHFPGTRQDPLGDDVFVAGRSPYSAEILRNLLEQTRLSSLASSSTIPMW